MNFALIKLTHDNISYLLQSEEKWKKNNKILTQSIEVYGTDLFEVACTEAKRTSYFKVLDSIIRHQKFQPNLPSNKTGLTPLLIACEYGFIKIVQLLLTKPNIDVNSIDSFGSTALFKACVSNSTSIVRLLISQDSLLADQSNIKGNTPFHMACLLGHKSIVVDLINSGKVDITKCNNLGQTALHLACTLKENKNYLEIIDLLLHNSKFLDLLSSTDAENETALHKSCQIGNYKEITKLIDLTNVNIVNKKGNTPETIFIKLYNEKNLTSINTIHAKLIQIVQKDLQIQHSYSYQNWCHDYASLIQSLKEEGVQYSKITNKRVAIYKQLLNHAAHLIIQLGQTLTEEEVDQLIKNIDKYNSSAEETSILNELNKHTISKCYTNLQDILQNGEVTLEILGINALSSYILGEETFKKTTYATVLLC
jgi:ankyrin repeat protein